jgi:hypothetical protein
VREDERERRYEPQLQQLIDGLRADRVSSAPWRTAAWPEQPWPEEEDEQQPEHKPEERRPVEEEEDQ